MGRFRCRHFLTAFALIGTVILVPCRAAELPEYKVKAALLYKLSKFVPWPAQAFADASAPFTLCVLGRNNFGTALDAVAGQTLGEREVAVRFVESADQTAPCQLVFISGSESYRLRGVLRDLQRAYLLTVSDQDGFATEGGMINLRTVAKKIRFEINLAAVKRARLQINAQLLQLATIVVE